HRHNTASLLVGARDQGRQVGGDGGGHRYATSWNVGERSVTLRPAPPDRYSWQGQQRWGERSMIQEPPKLTAMRLALGQQLAALREARGKVQQQIARRTGYSRSSVAKAEAGRQLMSPEFWQSTDELLEAKGELLASYERVLRAKQEHEA